MHHGAVQQQGELLYLLWSIYLHGRNEKRNFRQQLRRDLVELKGLGEQLGGDGSHGQGTGHSAAAEFLRHDDGDSDMDQA